MRLRAGYLRIENLSRSAYRDTSFYSCFNLLSQPGTAAAPALDGSTNGPVSYGPPPPAHTLPEAVVIRPGTTLDGWLYFEVRGANKSPPAPDFRKVHVLAFVPAGGGASAIGGWNLRR